MQNQPIQGLPGAQNADSIGSSKAPKAQPEGSVRQTGAAFNALLARLESQSQGLAVSSESMQDSSELADAVGQSSKALEQAQALSEQLLEASRAAQLRPSYEAMSIQTKIKTLRAQELIQSTFGKDRDLTAEYPLIFDPTFEGSLVGLEAEGEVISACAVLPRDLVLNGWLMRVGLIGSVATHEDRRGQGHAGRLLERAEDVLFHQGAVLSVLWADDAKFYEKKGFVPFGTELDYRIEMKDAAKLPEAHGVRFMESRDIAAMHALYVRHSHRVDRNLAETMALVQGPEITAIVREEEGEVVGYILMGRGADLQGMVHEWGGATDAVLACVRGLIDCLPPECPGLYLMCPVTSVDMRKTLLGLEIPALEGVLGMARIIDMTAIAKVFERFGDARLKVTVKRDSLVLHGPAGQAELDRQKTLLALMPPQGNRGVVEALEAQIGLRFDALPLAPFTWGLDSI